MARRKFDEATENHERWLISYADFITLLFAFFVVMYAISVVNEGKYRVFSVSLGDAFGGQQSSKPVGVTNIPPTIARPPLIQRQRAEALRHEKETLKKL